MTNTMKALDEIEAALDLIGSATEAAFEAGALFTYAEGEARPEWANSITSPFYFGPGILPKVRSALSLLPTLRAALAPAADDEVEAIRGRHDQCEAHHVAWSWAPGGQAAHNDRATLLDRDARHVSEIARLTAELEAERARRVEVEGEVERLRALFGVVSDFGDLVVPVLTGVKVPAGFNDTLRDLVALEAMPAPVPAVSGLTEAEREEGRSRLKAYRGAQGFDEHEALARWLVLHAEALLSPAPGIDWARVEEIRARAAATGGADPEYVSMLYGQKIADAFADRAFLLAMIDDAYAKARLALLKAEG